MIFSFILVLVSMSSIRGTILVGRVPQLLDFTACKVQLYEKLDKIQESEDPNALVLPYYNRTGNPCKTYCKFKSVNPNVAKLTIMIDSPYFILCASNRYCSNGGKCKSFGSPLKLELESVPKILTGDIPISKAISGAVPGAIGALAPGLLAGNKPIPSTSLKPSTPKSMLTTEDSLR